MIDVMLLNCNSVLYAVLFSLYYFVYCMLSFYLSIRGLYFVTLTLQEMASEVIMNIYIYIYIYNIHIHQPFLLNAKIIINTSSLNQSINALMQNVPWSIYLSFHT